MKSPLQTNRRIVLLVIIMTAIAIGVGGIVLCLLYRTSFKQQRERLREVAQSEARIIEAMARFDAIHGAMKGPEGAFAATLEQLKDAHSRFKGFGKTGEFTLARREGEQIVYLLNHRHHDLGNPRPVPFASTLGEPMRRALSGESGTIIGLDYRGETVLAAYEPVAELHLGVVAKIDMAEMRAPFIRAGLLAGGAGVVLVFFGTTLFLWIGNPIVRRLEENERKYRGIFESAADLLLLVDRDGKILDANPAACSAYGYSRDDFLEQTTRNIMYPWNDGLLDAAATVLREGKSYFKESVHVKQDGTPFPAEVTLSPITHKGRPAILAAVRDITERKRTEEALRVSHCLLQVAYRHAEMLPLLKEFVDELKDCTGCEAIGIRLLDEEGNIPYVAHVGFSEKFYRLESPLSIKSDKCMCINVIKGSTDPNLFFYTKGGSFYINGTTRFLATVPEELKRETRNVCNQYGYESVALVPVRGRERIMGLIHMADSRENMVPLYVVEVLEGVATLLGTAIERVRIQEELRDSEQRYRRLSESLEETVKKKIAELKQAESLAAIGQMVSVVAHEVRNPLQNIHAAVEALHAHAEQDKERSEILEEINYGVTILDDMVKGLSEYAKPLNLQYSMSSPGDMVQRALKMLSHELRNIIVHIQLDQEDRKLSVDAVKFVEVLVNLISNAADAMPSGGDLRIFSAFLQSDGGDSLVLSISDTGFGIEEKDFEHIFEPFFTTKARGTGLGLPICKRIIDAHNGTLKIKSIVNQGTTVEILLPTHRGQSPNRTL
ncbi:MAG: PAS domain S-box protein [Candidatus Abyssobacteria bacterium SURF_17]|uniref:histidine kinase n=1 Tax=Candidatus Abyssobacteria bacterium SURF_17 TaxID=2093361 RepID=A0A419EYU9_9BACT|nr:MAG: PAS domain S-box protein [Candidatus Abyssubacteria bacterium SURF_17]